MQAIPVIDGCCSPPRGRCASAPLNLATLIDEQVVIVIGDLFLTGHGSPEGVVTGTVEGQLYTDLDTGAKYTFTGTVGTKIGWV